MQLHLFSSRGESPIQHILNASTTLLKEERQPVVAYLPAACVGNLWIEFVEDAVRALARVISIDVSSIGPTETDATLDQASMLYIPGGNSYLLGRGNITSSMTIQSWPWKITHT